jgi:hypothetical protein
MILMKGNISFFLLLIALDTLESVLGVIHKIDLKFCFCDCIEFSILNNFVIEVNVDVDLNVNVNLWMFLVNAFQYVLYNDDVYI